jgi:16S rRNA processing protein RimM
MKQEDAFIVVGKVGSPYGLHGWVKVISFTEPATQIHDYTPWYLASKEGWKPIELTEARAHGKSLVAKFSGFNTPEEARVLVNKEIAVMRSQFPALKKDEYYWSDLEGLTVIDQQGVVLGKISYLIATGSNDVLVIKEGKKEIAIPYLWNDVITGIDLEKREMHVNWDLI